LNRKQATTQYGTESGSASEFSSERSWPVPPTRGAGSFTKPDPSLRATEPLAVSEEVKKRYPTHSKGVPLNYGTEEP